MLQIILPKLTNYVAKYPILQIILTLGSHLKQHKFRNVSMKFDFGWNICKDTTSTTHMQVFLQCEQAGEPLELKW